MIYQTLPWNWRPWLCGKGSKGTYNDSHIQFEICEDNLQSKEYWEKVRSKAVHLCAWLCQEYGIEPQNVIGHYEAAAAGYASNHADPQHWMKKHNDSMDKFRADVRMLLGTTTIPQMHHYVGVVKTKTSGFINVRETPTSSGTIIGKILDGEKVEVIGNNTTGTFAPISYIKQPAYVDTAYLIDRVYFDTEVSPEQPADNEKAYYTVTIYGYEDMPLTSQMASNLLEEISTTGYRVRIEKVNGGDA